MTQGSELKHILMFTLPLLAGNLFQQFYNSRTLSRSRGTGGGWCDRLDNVPVLHAVQRTFGRCGNTDSTELRSGAARRCKAFYRKLGLCARLCRAGADDYFGSLCASSFADARHSAEHTCKRYGVYAHSLCRNDCGSRLQLDKLGASCARGFKLRCIFLLSQVY